MCARARVCVRMCVYVCVHCTALTNIGSTGVKTEAFTAREPLQDLSATRRTTSARSCDTWKAE